MDLSSGEMDKLVSAIKEFSKTEMVTSEANTKKKIIEPLLDMLDWDTRGREVRLEYPIKIGSTSTRVDYALVLEDKPVVFVEAKPFSSTLSESDSEQVISYGRLDDVQWAVLTNGNLLKILNTKQGRTEEECLVTEIKLPQLPMNSEFLSLLSRESILTGDIEAASDRMAAARNAIGNLKRNQETIAEKFKDDLLEITGPQVENRVERISRQLAYQVIQMFEESAEPSGEKQAKEINSVIRTELAKKPDGDVVVCTSRIEGTKFLKKYNAWGYVNMSRDDIPYFALYVGAPESSVLYFAEIKSITPPLESKEDLVRIQQEDAKSFQSGQRVIHLKPGTLIELDDPIPLVNRKKPPRTLRYTTLDKLVRAEQVNDL